MRELLDRSTESVAGFPVRASREARALARVPFVVLILTCCARTAVFHEPRRHGAIVEIQNQELDDMVVYLIRGGTPLRLGIVPGLTRRMLVVSDGQLGNGSGVSLAAARSGRPLERLSDLFNLPPGHVVTWRVRLAGTPEQPVVR